MTSRAAKTFFLVLALATAAAAATLPAGTHVTVRTASAISSGTAHSGEMFDATLVNNIVVNGQTIAKAGAPVKGRVTYARPSGRLSKPGLVTVRLVSISGQTVHTSPVSRQGKSHTKSNVTKIGGGAAAGTVVGALVGGGKGAAIGAG
ncbi:MAG TPA: hypothetical protein VE825_15580, partial [Terriglobales bacterium]|nr:hypothetical protein [Terriglobales bacterium]